MTTATQHPILGASEIVTGNPILEALGVAPAEIQAHDPAEVDVSIFVSGVRDDALPVFVGVLRSAERRTYEGFYKLGANGHQIGPCISAPFTATKAGGLRALAQAFIGRNPKAGELAEVAEMLRVNARVVFSPRRTRRA